MKCIYCDRADNDYLLLNKTVEYSGIEIALNRQGTLRVRYYEDDGQIWFSEDVVNIKFCPNCGRAINPLFHTVETIGYADETVLASAT